MRSRLKIKKYCLFSSLFHLPFHLRVSVPPWQRICISGLISSHISGGVLGLEGIHELDGGLDVLEAYGVVGGQTDAAHGAVALGLHNA